MIKNVLSWALTAVIFAMYLFSSVLALGNLLGLNELAQVLELKISALHQSVLILAFLLPLAVFAAAIIFARRKSPAYRMLYLLFGLTVVALMQLNVMHFFPASRLLS